MNDHTSIILVTHDQLEFTKLCVESIERQTADRYELIVVDNGSRDGTVEWGKSLGRRAESGEPERGGPERVTVIANAENRGFPAAVNQGIRAATGRQILLLNNDTVVTPGWLGRMLRAMQSPSPQPSPRARGEGVVGIVGPVSNFVSGPQQVAVTYEGGGRKAEGGGPEEEGRGSRMEDGGSTEESGRRMRIEGRPGGTVVCDLSKLDQFAIRWGEANEGRVVETDRLVGFCLLIRREVVDRIGLFDGRFGIGNFEDDDYCRRARAAGFRLAIAADAFVHHFGGRTFIGSGVDHGTLMRRNEQLYREKWTGTERGSRNAERGIQDQTAATESSSFIASVSGPQLSALRPLLSLCMIARDNERTIAAALETIRKYLDDIVVVDTGSTDRTAEIAASFGARVFHFPWCDDFSAARNESIRHALGQWIFWMDTDDVIDEENARKVKELVLSLRGSAESAFASSGRTDSNADIADDRRGEPAVLGYLMKVRCPSVGSNGNAGYVEVDQVKLFRNLPGIRFEGRIHEQVLMAIRRVGGTVAWTDIFVVHANADQSPEGRAKKIERDLRILQLDHRERPDHPFVLFNLGMTLAEAGRLKQELGDVTQFEQKETKATKVDDFVSSVAFCLSSPLSYFQRAVDFLWQSIGLAGEDESHLRKAFALLVSNYRQLGRHVTAWETCLKGRKRFPDDVELRFRQAAMLRDVGNLPDAARAFEDLLAIQNGRHLSSVDGSLQGNRAHENLAEVYTSLGEFAKADAEWRRVVAEVPNDPAFRERHCRLLFEHFEPAVAEPAFRELVARDPQNAAALHNLGSILYKLGRFDEAIAAYRQSLELRPESAATWLHLGHALREGGRLDEAIIAWEDALRAEPADAAVSRELQQLIASRGGGIKQAG